MSLIFFYLIYSGLEFARNMQSAVDHEYEIQRFAKNKNISQYGSGRVFPSYESRQRQGLDLSMWYAS